MLFFGTHQQAELKRFCLKIWLALGILGFCHCSVVLNYQLARVKKVYDGDTILLTNGERVRYLYIDTPEIHHPRKPPEPYGYLAWHKNQELLKSGVVILSYDLTRRDRYGRLLARVYSRNKYLNAELVKMGYARVLIIPPNIADKNYLLSLQKQAKTQLLGIWSPELTIPKSEYGF